MRMHSQFCNVAHRAWSRWSAAAFVALAGCLASAQPAAPPPPTPPPAADTSKVPLRVVVSIPPLVGLVKPLVEGGEVRSLLAPGRSEHGFELTPADVAALARADLIVVVGLGLDAQVERAAAKIPAAAARVVNFAAIAGVSGDDHDHDEHDEHGGHDEHDHDGHDHHHAGADPHVWLDPSLCELLVRDVARRVKERGGDAPKLDARAAAQIEMIRAVDAAWRTRLQPMRGRAIVTHHNAFSRPAERYGFRVATVIRAGAGEPTPGEIAEVVRTIRAEQVRAVLVEPQYDAAVAKRLAAAADVPVRTIDPVGTGDWEAMMRKNLDAIAAALGEASPSPTPERRP